jgi:LytTr DNA-binding domain
MLLGGEEKSMKIIKPPVQAYKTSNEIMQMANAHQHMGAGITSVAKSKYLVVVNAYWAIILILIKFPLIDLSLSTAYFFFLCVTYLYICNICTLGAAYFTNRLSLDRIYGTALSLLIFGVLVSAIQGYINQFDRFGDWDSSLIGLVLLTWLISEYTVYTVHLVVNQFLTYNAEDGSMPKLSGGTGEQESHNDNSKFLSTSLIWVEAQQNYVVFHMVSGKRIVRIPFHRAIAQLPASSGRRIHRSYWVVANKIIDVRQIQGKWVVVMSDGTRLALSEHYISTTEAISMINSH